MSNDWPGFSTRAWRRLAGIVAVTAAVAVAGAAWSVIPDAVVVHWGVDGRPTLTVSKPVGLGLFPILALGLVGVFAGLPRLGTLGRDLAASVRAYETLVVWSVLLVPLTQLTVIAWNLGVLPQAGQPVVLRITAILTGALVYGTASLLSDVSQNRLFGVRTPWTLADERVWKRTHERAIPLLRVAGVATTLAALVPSLWLAVVLLIAPTIFVTVALGLFSYREYHRLAETE